MGTTLIDRTVASEIRDHDVDVLSYHPNEEAEGEYGFMVTREFVRGTVIVTKVICESDPRYNTGEDAIGAGDDFVREIKKNSFDWGEI